MSQNAIILFSSSTRIVIWIKECYSAGWSCFVSINEFTFTFMDGEVLKTEEELALEAAELAAAGVPAEEATPAEEPVEAEEVVA